MQDPANPPPEIVDGGRWSCRRCMNVNSRGTTCEMCGTKQSRVSAALISETCAHCGHEYYAINRDTHLLSRQCRAARAAQRKPKQPRRVTGSVWRREMWGGSSSCTPVPTPTLSTRATTPTHATPAPSPPRGTPVVPVPGARLMPHRPHPAHIRVTPATTPATPTLTPWLTPSHASPAHSMAAPMGSRFTPTPPRVSPAASTHRAVSFGGSTGQDDGSLTHWARLQEQLGLGPPLESATPSEMTPTHAAASTPVSLFASSRGAGSVELRALRFRELPDGTAP